ncbi:hypothetical protein BSL78_16003 [Apostichopus japonicus]|uniref:Uncharacterized protein n=1 Tax=Stichopus japonicus TaxID=307972 RepID=A0A2G8KGN2_STIJA|nr:hypothetical protein BSL78_16003 [Apostichopus japonicus]
MASLTFLEDLTESFFMCPNCLDHFREPKLLPCLHRLCRNCLKEIVRASHDGTFKCPMCKHECLVPTNGELGFKTDFHMKSMLEFIQLQNSYENKDLKKCVSCSKCTTVSAYCFKCEDFLCDQCYIVHVSNKMFKEHIPHSLKLDHIESKNLTLEKLSAISEDPRCQAHVKHAAMLCCCTCENVPVCIACTYGKHKGHNLHDVTELAESERKLLESKLAEIDQYKSKLLSLPQQIDSTAKMLNENDQKKTDTLQHQYDKQVSKVQHEMGKSSVKREHGLKDIECNRKEENKLIDLNYNEELNKLKEKYREIRKTTKSRYDDECGKFNVKCEEIDSELQRKLKQLAENLRNLTTIKEKRRKEYNNQLMEMSDYCDKIINRYQNFTATTSSILASKDEWTYSQCIPDIRAACEPLIEEMKKEYPQLESLSDFSVCDITKVIPDNVIITDNEESVVDINGFRDNRWWINGMACSGDGNIVITGACEPEEYSHISVINRKGKILRQDQMERELGFTLCRFCCPLSKFKVVTVCIPDEIGIYDVRNGSYHSQKISDVITSWPQRREVFCVASDSVKDKIVVGTNSRHLYVFDGQLNYSHTTTLPDVFTASSDITIQGQSFLICDYYGKRAFAVDIDGSESKMRYEFTKPDLDEADWVPFNVCTDKSDYIYMLWRAEISGHVKRILTQYSQDGRQLLSTRRIDDSSRCVTTLQMDTAEKLIIVTSQVGKMYTYGLVEK